MSAVEGDISSFQYRYKGQEDEISLGSSVKPSQKIEKSVYVELADELSVPFSSLAFPTGKNGLFVPYGDFEKEFVNGVVVDIPNGAADQMAHMFLATIGRLSDSFVEVNSYLIKFYSIDASEDDLSDATDIFPSEFSSEIAVFIPVTLQDGTEEYIEENYTVEVNSSDVGFQVVERDNQKFIKFLAKDSSLKILIFDKSLIEEGF